MPTGQTEQPGVSSPAGPGDKIDRIRDLLLPGSLDELDHKLSRLEEQLHTFESSLRDDIERRFADIDGGFLRTRLNGRLPRPGFGRSSAPK